MSAQYEKSSWPLLCILACLFIVSALAPRSWERTLRSPAAADLGNAPLAGDEVSPFKPKPALRPVVPSVVSPTERQPAESWKPIEIVTAPKLAQPAGKIATQYVPKPSAPKAAAAWDFDIKVPLVTPAEAQRAEAAALALIAARGLAEPMAMGDVDEIPAFEIPAAPAAVVASDMPLPVDETNEVIDLPEMDEPVALETPEAASSEPSRAAPSPAATYPTTSAEGSTALGDWVARQRPVEDEAGDEAEEAAPAVDPPVSYPQATSLRQGLENLASECETGRWAIEALRLVDKLQAAMSWQSDEAPSVLQQLADWADWAEPLANQLDNEMLARRMRQTAYALQRRLRLWEAAMSTLTSDEACGLLEHVEHFEQSGLISDGRRLIDDWQRLQASADDEQRSLGAWLEEQYRNANFRTVITADLLNRLAPAPEDEYSNVEDTIMGMPVRGQSVTSNRIGVRLTPDEARLRMSFMVNGQIGALTASDAGLAKFYDRSDSVYYAAKEVEVDAGGIRLYPAQISVRNQTQLRGVKTSLDPIPIVGFLAQNIAKTQHDLFQPWANAEAEQKISVKARSRIDEELYARLNNGVGTLRDRLFVPLDRLAIRPEQISAETTNERMTMRLRMAVPDQIGGFTPRPRALSDSLLSLQIHESSINNFLSQLKLDGQTFTLPELSKYVANKLNRSEGWACDADHEDVEVTFAQQDPISVRCRDGQLILTLSIARLAKAPRQWRDFQVRVAYRPEAKGREAEFVRDGVVQLISKRLNNAGQIAVRGIFSRTFSKNQRWKLTPPALAQNPGLKDIAVTQFEIDEGWIALAMGPETTVAQLEALRR